MDREHKATSTPQGRTEPRSQEKLVTITDRRIDPAVVTIPVGWTVRWHNADANLDTHLLESNPGDTGCDPPSAEYFREAISPDGYMTHRFNTPGTFHYHLDHLGCANQGQVIVTPAVKA